MAKTKPTEEEIDPAKLAIQRRQKALDEMEKRDLEMALDFYPKSDEYEEVHVVRCDQCNGVLALEVLNRDPGKREPDSRHTDGRTRIEIGQKLLATRVRTDGVMGYQCICGNDTRAAAPEIGIIPSTNSVSIAQPHQVAAAKTNAAVMGHKPDVTRRGNKVTIESFTIERIK